MRRGHKGMSMVDEYVISEPNIYILRISNSDQIIVWHHDHEYLFTRIEDVQRFTRSIAFCELGKTGG